MRLHCTNLNHLKFSGYKQLQSNQIILKSINWIFIECLQCTRISTTFKKKKNQIIQVLVAHSCKPIYLGG
jgi:hypothetical protein